MSKKFASDEDRRKYFREKKREQREKAKRRVGQNISSPQIEEPQATEPTEKIVGQVGQKSEFYPIMAGRTDKNAIVHDVRVGKERQLYHYFPDGVRCGIAAGHGKIPASYIIGAIERPDKFDAPRTTEPVIILKEFVHGQLGTESLFAHLASDADLFQFRSIYTNPTLYEALEKDWHDFSRGTNVRLDFSEAPPAYSGRPGLDLLKDRLKNNTLIIDRSLAVWEQASSGSWTDLDDKGRLVPEERFFLIEPLIFLVSGFKVYPPKLPPKPYKPHVGGHRDSWMGL